MKIIPCALLFLLFCTGCKKQDLKTFASPADIYFNNHYGDDYLNSITSSFATKAETVLTDTISVRVQVTGALSDRDRRFNMVVEDSSTAQAGRDYETSYLVADSLFIPANQTSRVIKIIAKRNKDLEDKSLRVIIRLIPNENFDTNILTITNGADKLSSVNFYINIDNIFPKPGYWDTYVDYLGTFSKKKLLLMAEVTGFSLSLMESYMSLYADYFGFATQQYLDEEAGNGNIILENDGTPMEMGPLSK